jgi:O-antigen/teichoic acid export membrane protein
VSAPQDAAPAASPLRDRKLLASRFLWSIASFGSSFALRLASTVLLARLLDPHVLGVMVVINALRYGVELLSDVGIEQNVVQHAKGAEPDFFNTAWTIQILRGALLTAAFLALAVPLGRLYEIEPQLLCAVALAPLLNSAHSTSIFLLVRNLAVRSRMLFELTAELVGFAATVLLVLVSPTAWSVVGGMLIGIGFRSLLSYRLPRPRHRLALHRVHSRDILRFGGWMFLSSLLLFLSTNVDRLLLGKLAPLGMVGIYGIARSISDVPGQVAGRLSYQLLLPLFAARRREGATLNVQDVSRARLLFVLCGALGLGTALPWSDLAIRILFDQRYQAAEWMLFALLPGAWFACLGNLNESVVLGSNRPDLNATANLARMASVVVGLPLGYWLAGLPGAIVAIVVGEVARYLALAAMQTWMGVSFWRQDALGTLAFAAVAAVWIVVRTRLGGDLPWIGFMAAWNGS